MFHQRCYHNNLLITNKKLYIRKKYKIELVEISTHSEKVCSCDEGTKIRPASEIHPGFIKAQQQR